MRGSRKAKRHALPPKGRLRYIKGKDPTLQFITKAASANQDPGTFTPTRDALKNSPLNQTNLQREEEWHALLKY